MKIMIQHMGTEEAGPIFAFQFAKGLVCNDQEVYAVLQNDIYNKKDWIDLLGADNIVFLHGRPERRRLFKSIKLVLGDLLNVYRKFRNITFDYCIRTMVDKYDDLYLKGIRVTQVINFCHDPIAHSGVAKKIAEKSKRMINNADKIIIMTKQFYPIIRNEYNRNDSEIIVIKHGYMTEYRNRLKYTPRRYYPDQDINFLFFGRIDPYKGVDILVESFGKVYSRFKNVTLTIAGKGELSLYLKTDLTNEGINIINRYIEDNEIETLLSRDNLIVVLPYKDATQSGVISLAYDYEIPIIASDTGGLKEQLFEGEVGVLVENNNVDALTEAMISFVENEDLYDAQCELIRKIQPRLEWNIIIRDLIGKLC